jgi:hypothetical protein
MKVYLGKRSQEAMDDVTPTHNTFQHNLSMTWFTHAKMSMYSGCKTTVSFSDVTERGEGKMERTRGSKTAKSLSEHV